jgi:hypothetical protein
VARGYDQAIAKLGSELSILQSVPVEDIAHAGSPLLAEAITRLRAGRVIRIESARQSARNIDEMGISRVLARRPPVQMTRHDPPCLPMIFHVTVCSWQPGRDMSTPSKPNRNDLFDPDEELDPLFQEAEEQARRRDFQARMRELNQRWREGDKTAPVRAVRALIMREEWPQDWWVLDAVEQLFEEHMPDDEKRLRREFDMHQRRHEAVTELYERRFELAKDGDYRGMTLEDCYVAASELSWETEPWVAGGAETMKRSYRLIEAAGGKHATLEKFKRVRHLFS